MVLSPAVRAAGQSYGRRGGRTDVWLTPPEIIAQLGGWESFALDPCAAPRPRPWPTAVQHIAPPGDGLTSRWYGRVWLNPPYSNAGPWVARLADHGCGIALIFARTDARWFSEHVWLRATAVLFLKRRLRFYGPDGNRPLQPAPAPAILAAYSMADATILGALDDDLGVYIPLTPRSSDSHANKPGRPRIQN